ncbi:diguanylate cyclase [Rubellimicrobium rubrum]|uniref:Diguanylate cyclase n=1 Tax=Rubellimicrobium rubrum TaxID=2585369 RepID=A0A5C4MHG8_9RHOB|nr:diguanylate cyclase [Rubellimicrobium rubrum]TNC43769.1 diguanylate cyclase [Rubellimicrobium rubrum]
MTTSTLPGRIAAVMVGAIVVLVLTTAVSIVWMTRALDQQSRDHSGSMVRTAFSNVLNQTLVTNLDYAKWPDVVDATAALDMAWLSENVGASTTYYDDLFHLVVEWGGPLPRDVGWMDTGAPEGTTGLLSQATLEGADARLQEVPLGASSGVTFFALSGDELFAIAASRVERTEAEEPAPDAQVARLLIGRRVNDALLDVVARSTLLDDLEITRLPPADRLSLPLEGADGQPVAHVSWQTPLAGTRLLHRMLPLLLLVMALATGLVLLGMVLTRRSAHHLIEAEKRSAMAARTDALTGLPNRFAFGEILAQPARAEERAILFLDLNGFKRINDDIGHATGDLVIRWMAERLAPLTTPGCRIARIGGDEFVFVLTGPDAGPRTVRLAQEVERTLVVPFEVQGHSLHLRAAMGFAVQTADLVHGDDLVRQADLAMYEAKRHRSGPVAFNEIVEHPACDTRNSELAHS